jgi:hypothetical protein
MSSPAELVVPKGAELPAARRIPITARSEQPKAVTAKAEKK